MPVSTPLRLEELTEGVRPRNFGIRQVLERIERLGDLYEPTLWGGQSLGPALRSLQKAGQKQEDRPVARVIPVNGSKHITLTSYSVEGAASVAREYAGAGQVRYVVPRAGGRNVEALPLADACIAEIRTFMQKQGLIQLAPASKSRQSGRPG